MNIKLKSSAEKKDGGVWFAWYPVYTKNNRLVWLEKVYRKWNPEMYFSIIDPYDHGDYVGGWEYITIHKD